jgi:hypothetical protein
MHDRLRDPEETEAGEKDPPMTQEKLDAIWAKHQAQADGDNFKEIEDAFTREIAQHGGEWMMWDHKVSGDEVGAMFVEMLRDHGWVVLDNPLYEGSAASAYVFFWPDQNGRADAGSDQDDAPATIPMTAN